MTPYFVPDGQSDARFLTRARLLSLIACTLFFAALRPAWAATSLPGLIPCM